MASKSKNSLLTVRELVIFSMLGAVMYVSKLLMEFLPNIHLIATFIIATTIVYKKKALYPLYIYILLDGLFHGFGTWWFPYLYIWLPPFFTTLLVPDKINIKIRAIIYMLIAALHGFLYGTLYAPFQALVFGLSFKSTIAWIIAGLPFDLIHGISNFFVATLVIPLCKVLQLSNKTIS